MAEPTQQQIAHTWVFGVAAVAAFRNLIKRWHDAQQAAVNEELKARYLDWLDTREPGQEEMPYNENNPDPEVFEEVWIEAEKAMEDAVFFTLGFAHVKSALDFGIEWGKLLQPFEANLSEQEGGQANG